MERDERGRGVVASAGRLPESGPFALPRGLMGLIAIAHLDAWRAATTVSLVALATSLLFFLAVRERVPGLVLLAGAVVAFPAGMLALPVAGMLRVQRLSVDYRQLGGRRQLRLWFTAWTVPRWPLPAGALCDPAMRRHAACIVARAARIVTLARGARAVLAVEIAVALRDMPDAATAQERVDDAIRRVMRWEEAAVGLPPVGAKLYLRRDPLSRRAARARVTAARLGVASDQLNYFWRGQVLLLPPARSHRTLAALVDALIAAGVAPADRPLPLQITVQGDLGDEAKLIPMAQLVSSGLDLALEGPERRGDDGNLVARGRLAPERVAGDPGRVRTDLLFSLVWASVPEMAAAGYADQHHRDLRVAQTLAGSLLASRARTPDAGAKRLGAVWREFADGFAGLCAAHGAGEAVRMRYLDAPFAAVQPAIEQLLARKAEGPDMCHAARRLRDRALALVEFDLIVRRLRAGGRLRRVQLGQTAGGPEQAWPLRGGLRRVRRAVRAGVRVALVTREGDTMKVLLDRPSEP